MIWLAKLPCLLPMISLKKLCLKVQFTEDSRSGTPGLRAARHAQEEFSNAFASAPIPGQPTEEKNAVDWGQL